jgi:hypothetical protein
VIFPPGWEDHSVYKRTEPVDDRRRGALGGPAFRHNVVVTSHEMPEGIDLDQLLRRRAATARDENPSLQVLNSGHAAYLEQSCAWLDASFFDPRGKLQIFQRLIALSPAPGRITLITVTTDDPDLDGVTRAMGLD